MTVSSVRPLTRQQTALPVDRGFASTSTAHDGYGCAFRAAPMEAAGGSGPTSVRLVRSPWRLVVSRAQRQARLLDGGRLVEVIPVVVGAPSTPTPRGQFFVAEHVRQTVGSSLGKWALATSAHSNVLQEFDGGPGQIALHGRRGPLAIAPLGSAASHGCVRFDNDVIDRLARVLPNGTPMEIR